MILESRDVKAVSRKRSGADVATEKIESMNFDDLSEDQKKMVRATAHLNQENQARLAQMRQMGAEVDFASAQVDHLISSLRSLGVITDDQFIAIKHDWERGLARQTKQMVSMMQAQIAEMQKQARQQQTAQTGVTPSGLVVPPSAAGAVQ